MKRVGTYFILLGILLVGLYVLSDIAKSPTFWLLAAGGLAIGLGIGMRMSGPKPETSEPVERFRLLKRKKNPADQKAKGSNKKYELSLSGKKQAQNSDESPAGRGKTENQRRKKPGRRK